MKARNRQYFTELEENYKKFQKVLETKNQKNLTIDNKNQIANEISELSLTYLAKISETIEGKYGK